MVKFGNAAGKGSDGRIMMTDPYWYFFKTEFLLYKYLFHILIF